jgi:tRNA nucleotidyltransferase (CCA-adding enzyme)
VKTVILGHVGADFDCVASMAGLSRLYTGAAAVLPTSLEPNVEEFLRLYEGRFRFQRIPVSALLKEEIDTVILADTIVALRLGDYGALLSRKNVRIVAYDHHELSSTSLQHIDEGHIQKCGATASLVTAALREQFVPVNPDEATLLALGIYEDTGSLLFPETTAFDVEQAAYLLKAGASLSMVARFVTTYLVPKQQAALESALTSVSVQTVAGAQIAFATVQAPRNVGNLSVIVHRLSQIVRADALFLLYRTPEAMYVLGRSDRFLNVAELLAPLGGAGRIHAAACILRDNTSIETAREHIVESISARRTQRRQVVREIMTPDPVVIPDDTPASEALQTMVNLGFSVLPVQHEGTLAGIVAKKALEKTSLERLREKPVRYFLNTRLPVVSPLVTAEELVQAFGEYGTGLLLVMEERRLIGVISRSDVLRYLNRTSQPQAVVGVGGMRKISCSDLDRLGGVGTAETLARIGRTGEAAGNPSYLVGGSVRDVLLGVPPKDFDIVTEKDVSGVATAVAHAFDTEVISYGRFMTHKVHIGGREYDFASARLEYYDFPGSLPTVAPAPLVKDLLRRDFTINALAMSLASSDFGTVLDATGGLSDLTSQIVRITYPDSFIEDPARILRAVATQARLGFKLEDGTAAKAHEALELGLLNVRRNKRAQDEFKEMLVGGYTVACLEGLSPLGYSLLGLPLARPRSSKLSLLRELDRSRSDRQWGVGAPLWVAPLLVLLGDLPADELRGILKDFGMNDRLSAACRSWQQKERTLRRLVRSRARRVSLIAERLQGLPAPIIRILAARLALVGKTGESEYLQDVLVRSHEPALLSGKDVLGLGVCEGPKVGRRLDQVRRLQLDGILHSREEAVAYLCASKG